MPREIVSVRLEAEPFYESAAMFFAAIAYPELIDSSRREAFRIALCRSAVRWRARIDKDWGGSPQAISPAIFTQNHKYYTRTLRDGWRLLTKRIACAVAVVLPHLNKSLNPFVAAEISVDSLTAELAVLMGMSSKSNKTLQSKLWAPTKAVAHAAAALHLAKLGRHVGFNWNEQAPLCNSNFLYGSLFYPHMIDIFISVSESIRPLLLKVPTFRVAESETIKFVTDDSEY